MAKDQTEFVGRWRATASDEYVRTARAAVYKIQRLVTDAAAVRPEAFEEEEARLGLTQYLRERGVAEQDISAQLLRLQIQGDRSRKTLSTKVAPQWEFDSTAGHLPTEDDNNDILPALGDAQPLPQPGSASPQQAAQATETLASEDEHAPTSEAEAAMGELDDLPFWVSHHTRKLHATGYCHWESRTHICNRRYVYDTGASGWSQPCKLCFKGEEIQAQPMASDSSSSGSDSSSSTQPAKRSKAPQEASTGTGAVDQEAR